MAEQRAASQLAERLGGLIRAKGATPTTRFDLAPVGQRENGLVHVAWDRAVNQWHVFAVDAPPAPAGSAYCFWFVTAAGEYVATVLEETAPGVMATAATLPAKPSDVRRAVVTLEKLPPGERPRGEALWETAVVGDAQ